MHGPGTRPPTWAAGPGFVTFVGPAKLSSRAIAFLIDGLIMLAISVGVYVVSAFFGAWSIDDAWVRQYELNSSSWPNAPALHVNINAIAAISAAIAVAIVAFAVVCWVRLGALPGQRAMGLRVLDFENGKPLSVSAALLRSLTVFGAAGVVMSLYALLNFERLADFPLGDTSSQLVSPDSPLSKWVDLIGVVVFLGTIWLLLVAASCVAGQTRRGIHDRIGRSIVISIRKWPAAWPMPGAFPAHSGVQGVPGLPGIPGVPGGPGGPGAYPPGVQPSPDGYPAPTPYPPQPGISPAPGWTPPGYWTPPGAESPTDWAPPPGAVWPPGPSQPAGSPEPFPAESSGPAAPPWKSQAEAERPVSLATRESATMTRRVVAYGLDSLLVFLLFSAVFATISPDGGISPATISERVSILAGLAGGVMQLVYFVVGWTLGRATLGQRMAGIAVVTESDGKAIGPMDAIVRWAVLQGPFALATIVPLSISPIVMLAAAGWSAFLLYSTQNDANRQGIHDHFLRTRVVTV